MFFVDPPDCAVQFLSNFDVFPLSHNFWGGAQFLHNFGYGTFVSFEAAWIQTLIVVSCDC